MNKLDEEVTSSIRQLRAEGKSTTAIAALVGCCQATVSNILNPGQGAESARRRRINFRNMIQTIKLERGCADCGYNAHPAALDFDHRKGTVKLFGIGSSGSHVSKVALLAEIEKCDVVCANCHRIRTDGRGWGVNHR